jgi:hypothetical protein
VLVSSSQLANRLAAGGSLASVEHVRSLKDVFPLLLTRASRAGGAVDDGEDMRAAWECPLSGAPAGRAGVAFTALRPCGHVVASRVLANVRSPCGGLLHSHVFATARADMRPLAAQVADELCGVCGEAVASVQALNVPAEEEERLRSALLRKRKRKHRADA